MNRRLKIALPVVLISGSAFLAALAILVWRQKAESALGDKLLAPTFQFLLVVVVGGFVSLVYSQFAKQREYDRDNQIRAQQQEFDERQRERDREYTELQRSRDQREVERRYQQEIYLDLARVRMRTLRVAITIRAEGTAGMPEGYINAQVYRREVLNLLDALIDLNHLVARMEAAQELFADPSEPQTQEMAAQSLLSPLTLITRYLNRITGEYEMVWAQPRSGEPDKFSFWEIRKMGEFLGYFSDVKDFETNFDAPFRKASGIIQRAILS